MRIVSRDELSDAMLEYELSEIYPDMDDRVPFTQDEADAMAESPCEYGYHLWESDDPDYEGLMCARGCGYGIG